MKDIQVGFFPAGSPVPAYDLQRTTGEGEAELSFVLTENPACDLTGQKIGVYLPPHGYLAVEAELTPANTVGDEPVSLGIPADPNPGPDEQPGFFTTQCLRAVFGQVWEDRNADGLRTADEPLLEGVRVAFQDPEGKYGPDDFIRTSTQGTVVLERVLREGCDLSGYSFSVIDELPGYLIPESPLDLVALDEGGPTVKAGIGLVLDPSPSPTPEAPVAAGQCFRGVFIEAWKDNDLDGQRGEDEWPVGRVLVGLVPPGEELISVRDDVSTTPQGFAELGFVVGNADCDLTGYRLLVMRAPVGTSLPDLPVIDLGALDTGEEILRVKIGLPPREE